MRKIFYLMAMAITAVSFTACMDDDNNYIADVNYPKEATGNEMLVEAYANEFTFDINTKGAWKVVSDRRFLHVRPNEGNGNATVTVSVEANQSDDRKLGNLTIVFPGHEGENKTFVIEQKFAGDYAENGADIIDTSDKIYAVGYSYDCTGEYASPNSVRKEVLDGKAMIEDGVLAVNAVQASLTYNTITGSSISEMTNSLSVKANVKGGFGKFKAEASASFDMNNIKNSNYEFASTYFDLEIRHASLSKDIETLKDDYMTDDAWNAINGVPVTNKRGITKVSYPSTNEGFKKLIEEYGTHVIVEAGLGGRVRYCMSVDISKIESSYDIKAFAKASYAGIVTAEGSVDEKYKQSFKDNQKKLNIQLNVLGGDAALATKLGTEDGFNKANLEAWINSVTKNENMSLVSFSDKSLVPIYELVEKNATVENGGFNGMDRYNDLKEYIDGIGSSTIATDFSSYDCGTVTEFDVPSFEDAGYNKSLIKDIIIDGQYVGQVCNEYIPNIDRENRVTVVYPFINNKARYNMGFFLGNNTHKPARVSWDGTDVHVEEYADLDFGKVTKLYLRGSSITATPPDGTEPQTATAVKDEYLNGIRKNVDHGGNDNSNYPLVKIFDKIWTRENYRREVLGTGYPNWGHYVYNGVEGRNDVYWEEYYTLHSAQDPNLFPAGWRVATGSDFQTMKNKLVANGWGMAASALKMGAVTGFDIVWSGWVNKGTGGYTNSSDQMEYVTSDAYHIRLKKDGTFDICPNEYNAENWLMSIRLVKE
ncbi:MAG: MAC/perforin domain-containing protein [Bacteroidaceae bacterium]